MTDRSLDVRIIRSVDEAALRRWANGDDQDDLGGPSDALVPSRAARRARSARLRELRLRLAACDARRAAMLRVAFRRGESGGLLVYGHYPRAALGSSAARRLFAAAEQAARADSPPLHADAPPDTRLEGWLRAIGHESIFAGPGASRLAGEQVREIRDETNRELHAALVAVGVDVRSRRTPAHATLREIARVTGLHRDTVHERIVALKVLHAVRARRWLVSVAHLRLKWPAAAAALRNS